MRKHKFFSLSKSKLAILLISNIIFAWWLHEEIGTYRGWSVVDLSADLSIGLPTLLAVLQFVLLGFSIDMSIRTSVSSINSKLKVFQVPSITVMALTVATYGSVGIVGFILLYDHSFSKILAAAGATGLGVAYLFRELIADAIASLQIQADHLASINDYIQVKGDKEVFKVTQIDHRMITLEDKYHFLLRVPTHKFLNWQYINLTKQPEKRGVMRRCLIRLTSRNDSNRVLSAMNIGMKYLNAQDERFYLGYACQIDDVTMGEFVYGISYECHPSISFDKSSHLVNQAILHIFKAAAIDTNSYIAVYKNLPIAAFDASARLLDIYRSSILKVLDTDQIEALSNNVNLVTFEVGEQVIRQGEHAKSMYIISEGHLDIGILDKEGKEIIVATLWPGDCLGEMSLLTGEPRSANVYGKSSGILLEITKENLAPFLDTSPQLIEKFSQVLSDRKSQNEKTGLGQGDQESRLSSAKALGQKIFKFFFGTA